MNKKLYLARNLNIVLAHFIKPINKIEYKIFQNKNGEVIEFLLVQTNDHKVYVKKCNDCDELDILNTIPFLLKGYEKEIQDYQAIVLSDEWEEVVNE